MAITALIICLFICALGVVGIFSPEKLVEIVRRFASTTGLLVVAAIRIVLGAALYLAAPWSRAPEVLLVLGVFIFVLGVATPFFGVERSRRVLDSWSGQGSDFVRVWAFFTLAFGLWLAHMVAG